MWTEAPGESKDPAEPFYFIASLPEHFIDWQIAMCLIKASGGQQGNIAKRVVQQAPITDHRLGVDARDSKAATIDEMPAQKLTPIAIENVSAFRHLDSVRHRLVNLKRRR